MIPSGAPCSRQEACSFSWRCQNRFTPRADLTRAHRSCADPAAPAGRWPRPPRIHFCSTRREQTQIHSRCQTELFTESKFSGESRHPTCVMRNSLEHSDVQLGPERKNIPGRGCPRERAASPGSSTGSRLGAAGAGWPWGEPPAHTDSAGAVLAPHPQLPPQGRPCAPCPGTPAEQSLGNSPGQARQESESRAGRGETPAQHRAGGAAWPLERAAAEAGAPLEMPS